MPMRWTTQHTQRWKQQEHNYTFTKHFKKPVACLPAFSLPTFRFWLFICVIHFHFGQRDTFYLTLSERVTLASPVFIFEFDCRVPDQVVRMALFAELNGSRCERFTIDTNNIFPDHDAGQYKYRVFEAPAPAEGEEVT